MALPKNPFTPSQNAEKMITDPVVQKEEQELDTGLRPKLLSDFIGQQQLTSNLRIFIDAALARKEPLDHVLLHGNPGLGKTTLAHIIAHELHENIRVTSGPALSRVGDLAAILTNLGRGDILFIDEIHRLNKIIEEVLYPAMEDFALDLVVGKGPSARSIRLQLEPFTIIGATTRMNLLSSPLRDRFGVSHHLEFYTDEDIEKILTRSSELLHIAIDEDARKSLAARARKTPRIANRLLKRVRDFAEVKYDGRITHAIANEALSALAIDIHGMDATDRLIIKTIVETFNGGPVGLNTLAAALSEDEATIEEIYEPFLLQQGFLHRTPRGRIATERAYQYLGAKQPTLV